MGAILFIILFLPLFAGLALLAGLIWMLGLGALSHIFHQPSLAIGYWQAVLVGFIVNLLLGGIGGSARHK